MVNPFILDFFGDTNATEEAARNAYDSVAEAVAAAPEGGRWLVFQRDNECSWLVAAAPQVLSEQPEAPAGLSPAVWQLGCTAYRHAEQVGAAPEIAAQDAVGAALCTAGVGEERAYTSAWWYASRIERELNPRSGY